jgi:hypothetical protein
MRTASTAPRWSRIAIREVALGVRLCAPALRVAIGETIGALLVGCVRSLQKGSNLWIEVVQDADQCGLRHP